MIYTAKKHAQQELLSYELMAIPAAENAIPDITNGRPLITPIGP
jgi:hypothetical protein